MSLLSILRSPGAGLLTVSTGSAAAKKALGRFFGAKDFKNWPARVEKTLAAKAPFYILGVPSDSGGGICRGAAHGPLRIREALYKKNKTWAKYDLGDVPCIPQLVHDSMLNEAQKKSSGEALWGTEYRIGLAVSPLNIVTDFLCEAWSQDKNFRPLVLGGDHSISGAIFEALDRSKKLSNLAVLHFDAHTDLLESRFGVEHCFGTWTSHALKKIKDPSVWVQLGIRASAKNQKHWQEKFGLKQYWAKELLKKDPKEFAIELCEYWKGRGCQSVYITNDIDGTDASEAPSTGTAESGGLKSAWVANVIKEVSKNIPLIGADLMEVAPVLGSKAQAKKTIATACKYLEALHWH